MLVEDNLDSEALIMHVLKKCSAYLRRMVNLIAASRRRLISELAPTRIDFQQVVPECMASNFDRYKENFMTTQPKESLIRTTLIKMGLGIALVIVVVTLISTDIRRTK